jgi:hypothetical protein
MRFDLSFCRRRGESGVRILTKNSILLDFRREAQRVSPIRMLNDPEAPPVCVGVRIGSA